MHRLLLSVLLLLISLNSQATPGEKVYVPDALKPWAPWVLHGKQTQRCTPAFTGETRLCHWPGVLNIELSDTEGRFQQVFLLEAPGWVILPGDSEHWPLDVHVDDQAIAVTQHKGRPAIFFTPTDAENEQPHRLSGQFVWNEPPDALPLPPSSALAFASLNGVVLPAQAIDQDNRLWLRKSEQAPALAPDSQSTSVQVYRKFSDDVPMNMETRLVLDVSQQSGELILGPALLTGFVAHEIDSPLPARLDAEQRLRLQVRPGRWTVRILARHPQPTDTLIAPSGLANPWPQEETWVFEPKPKLRLVEPIGLPALDPQQTRTPKEWKQLSTFRALQGASLKLRVERRGDPKPDPDRLRLERDMWLDFNGLGYSVRDRISGALSSSWRLRTDQSLQLGQVTVNGKPQLITTRQDAQQQGFEVRHGQLDLTADSLMPGDPAQPSANGWLLDFQHTTTRLHLPPGWTLLAAMGMDNVPDTWVQRWSLMDLFLVLLIVIGGVKAWGWGSGALLLPTLILTWQTQDAPQYIWLLVLVASVLRQATSKTLYPKLSKSIMFFLYTSLAGLLILVLPYSAEQVKTGLFPQLERPWQSLAEPQIAAVMAETSLPSVMLDATSSGLVEQSVRRKSKAPSSYQQYYPTEPRPLQRQDPDAKVQTGPGVPNWSWEQIQFSWNGPVSQEERLRFVLLPPLASGMVKISGALLVALLSALLLMREWRSYRRPADKPIQPAALLLLPLALLGSAQAHSAAYPSEALLQQLEQRLMQPETCLPHCAEIPRMALQVSDSELLILLQVDAQQASAIPIPSAQENWRIERAVIDDVEQRQLLRREQEQLWIRVPEGRHRVLLSGAVDGAAPITLDLPLLPRSAQVSLAHGWSAQGIENNKRPAHQIQLSRTADGRRDAEPNDMASSVLSPYLSLQRTFLLGLDWRINNQLRRLSPSENPLVIKIPLVEGESVLSESVKTDNGFAIVNLRPGQQHVAWESALETVDQLRLSAGDNPILHETWRLDASTLWHVQAEGIPPVHGASESERWLPVWRPWPGERLNLRIDRPSSIQGQTLTIDRAELKTRPGRRLSESSLNLSIRAAQGGQHSIQLPEGAKLQQVQIDQKAYPARQEGRLVTLPIRPGAMQAQIEWRGEDRITERFISPSLALNSPAVNASTEVSMGRDRWILWASGPGIGPAVQFWGVLLLVFVLSLLLGRVKLTPLRSRDWFLLGVGLSQTSALGALLPVLCLFAIGARDKLSPDMAPSRFNILQLALAFLSFIAILALFDAVQQGLLGLPAMNIGGNASSSYALSWYSDRVADGVMPSAQIISAPLLLYRVLMLAWALWLAFKLVHWVKWGWQAYCSPALWRKVTIDWSAWRRRKTLAPTKTTPIKDNKS